MQIRLGSSPHRGLACGAPWRGLPVGTWLFLLGSGVQQRPWLRPGEDTPPPEDKGEVGLKDGDSRGRGAVGRPKKEAL